MTVHAALAKELAGLKHAHDRFLALLGDDDDLQPALLNIIDRVGRVPLGKHDLVLAILDNGLSFADLGEKFPGVESDLIKLDGHNFEGSPIAPIIAVQTTGVRTKPGQADFGCQTRRNEWSRRSCRAAPGPTAGSTSR